MSYGLVNDLFRDSEGFLWVATFNGLDRFDGTGFKVFYANPQDSTAIADNYILHICEDKDGDIWCGSNKGVSRYNKQTGTFSNYPLSNPNGFTLAANQVNEILCDRHGTIWCGTAAGIFEYDKQANHFIGYYHDDKKAASPTNDHVFKNSFIEDPQADGIWMSGAGGINYLDTKTKLFYNYKNNPRHLSVFDSTFVYPLCLDSKANLWYIRRPESKMMCYNLSSHSITSTNLVTDDKNKPLLTDVETIFIDSKQQQWLSTWYYPLFFKEQNGKVYKRFSHDDQVNYSINSDFFWDAMEDRDGTLWFGGLNGISKLHPSKQYYYLLKPNTTLAPALQFHNIISLYQENDSILWLGTDEGLYSLNILNNICRKYTTKTYTLSGVPNVVSGLPVNAIAEIDSVLWLATHLGVKFFDLRTHLLVTNNDIPTGLTAETEFIGYIYKTANGDIWIKNNSSKALYRFDKMARQWHIYQHDDSDPHSVSTSAYGNILEDGKYNLWFGTRNDGLMRFDKKNNRFDFIKSGNTGHATEKIINVHYMCTGNEDELYLLSSGLYRYNYRDSSLKIWQQTDGLANNTIASITKDHYGNIWTASYQDVTVLKPKSNQLIKFQFDYSNTNYLYFNTSIALSDGRVCISIRDALAICNPDVIQKLENTSPILISDFSVFEKSIPFTQKKPDIHLSYKQNFFSISFSRFSGSGDDLQYAYKLEGYDHDWVYCGKRQFASYTNVPGGDYTFFVKSSVTKGEWSSPTTLHIFVSPPFWQTTWFRLLMACAAVFLVVALFKIRERNYRLKQEQKLQVLRVRDKIAQDLHDDVGSTLTSINIWSEIANRSSTGNREQSNELVNRIHESSQKMLDRMSDIIWSVNSSNDLTEHLLVRMRQHASDILEPKNINYEFRLDEGIEEMKLPMEKRREIFLIFKEAVNNLCKYAQCGNVIFEMKMQSGDLIFLIRDDGVGFDMNNNFTGNGLRNMKQRAKNINGTLGVRSGKGMGTEIRLQTKNT
jgi:signal transduction histidine kinase/streptogramin lyase